MTRKREPEKKTMISNRRTQIGGKYALHSNTHFRSFPPRKMDVYRVILKEWIGL